MSIHDVFNPCRGFDEALGFNANWNYGSPRKTGSNIQIQKPRFGPWSTREVSDNGYSFTLTFAERPIEQIRYIQRFYHQFKFGFFTLLDHDNGAREHVGRFTSYSDDTQSANLKYTAQVTFEELPGCPMRLYPNDWAHQSHIQPAVDDFGKFLAATSNGGGAVTVGSQQFNTPAWVAQAVPGTLGPQPHPQELFLAEALSTDFAQTQYIGWGFRMSLRQATQLGVVDLYVDGVVALAGIDMAAGTYQSPGVHGPTGSSPTAAAAQGLKVTGGGAGTGVPLNISYEGLPLGMHLIKLVSEGATQAQLAAGTGAGTGLIFPQIEVMH